MTPKGCRDPHASGRISFSDHSGSCCALYLSGKEFYNSVSPGLLEQHLMTTTKRRTKLNCTRDLWWKDERSLHLGFTGSALVV